MVGSLVYTEEIFLAGGIAMEKPEKEYKEPWVG